MLEKNVLVLSDDEMLSQVIELALGDLYQTRPVLLGSPEGRASCADLEDVDLIILALGSPDSEPVVALTRMALTEAAGQVPLLIISSKRFRPDSDVPIYHLDFPFDVRELRAKVNQVVFAHDVQQALSA